MCAPSSLDLKIGIACTVVNRLSENRCEIKEIEDVAIVKASQQVGIKMAKTSPKNYKLKPTLITLQIF